MKTFLTFLLAACMAIPSSVFAENDEGVEAGYCFGLVAPYQVPPLPPSTAPAMIYGSALGWVGAAVAVGALVVAQTQREPLGSYVHEQVKYDEASDTRYQGNNQNRRQTWWIWGKNGNGYAYQCPSDRLPSQTWYFREKKWDLWGNVVSDFGFQATTEAAPNWSEEERHDYYYRSSTGMHTSWDITNLMAVGLVGHTPWKYPGKVVANWPYFTFTRYNGENWDQVPTQYGTVQQLFTCGGVLKLAGEFFLYTPWDPSGKNLDKWGMAPYLTREFLGFTW